MAILHYSKNTITCITFSYLIPEAASYLEKAYPGAQLRFFDIKKIVLNPLEASRLLLTRSAQAIAFMPNLESGIALDLFGAAVFVTRARSKALIDCAGNAVPVTTTSGIKHILRCLADIATLPFAVVFFSLRASVLLARSRRKSKLNPMPGDKTTFAYFRTDTFEELRAGGSVAHTTGVIKGCMNYGLKPLYITPFPIKAVTEMHISMQTVKRPSLFRNFPELPLLFYSEYLSRSVLKIIADQAILFIYQRYSLNNYTGLLVSQKLHLPFILEYNGSEVWINRHWGTPLYLEKISEKIETAVLQAATLIVVVSKVMKDELLPRGINPDKILVNPNGVDPDRYSLEVDGSGIRRHYHLDGKTVIGFIGTFGRWHGAEVLAKAFGRLLREYPAYREKVRLLMIGDGITMPLVRENLKKYSVGDACILTGRIPQDEGPGHLAACDILASPHVPNPDGTPFFGSPTKLFEYMAMGKGIVASDLDQIGEILKHGETAWMVKPGNAESLMLGLKKLIDDKSVREKLGQAARQEVVAKYTWNEHTRKIIKKLQKVSSQDGKQ